MTALTRPQRGDHEPAPSPVERARETSRRWAASFGVVLLVADPEASPNSLLFANLFASGVNCTWCSDGAEALIQYGRLTPDALLLSPTLESVDAPTVVRTIRARDAVPIFLGVGRGDAEAAGPILVAGATAAVSRPFVSQEILDLLETSVPDIASRSKLSYGPIELDPRSYTVRLNGDELKELPFKEFELLRLLMMNADRVVTTEQIRSALWGNAVHPASSNTIAVHTARLRARLGDPALLRTIRGRGYRLTFPDGP